VRAARALRRWLAAEVERVNDAHAEIRQEEEEEREGEEERGGQKDKSSSLSRFSRELFVAHASASARTMLGAVFGALAAQDGEYFGVFLESLFSARGREEGATKA